MVKRKRSGRQEWNLIKTSKDAFFSKSVLFLS
jgi:hypothetical protein